MKNKRVSNIKGFSQQTLIIGVILIASVLIVGYYLSKNKNTSTQINTDNAVSSVTILEVNHFFPKTILSYPIKPVGGKFVKPSGEPYYVGPWSHAGTFGVDGAALKKVPISEGYIAYYGQSVEQTIIIHTAKLLFNEDKENLKKLLDTSFPSSTANLALPNSNTETSWGIYSGGVAKDEVAGDVRLFFNGQLRYVQIQVSGGISKDELIDIVKAYIDLVNKKDTSVVSADEILNMSEFLGLQGQ